MALIDDAIYPDTIDPASNDNSAIVANTSQVSDTSYAAQMMQIANNDIRAMDIGSAEQAKNQISMFLVSQAKNELYRIIKLTSFLDSVEAKYIDTATELMQQFPDNLSLVQNVLETIEKSITRSNELLTQILKDEKLNTYVFNFHPTENESENIYKNINKASRDDLRNFANSMLQKLNNAADAKSDEPVIEVDANAVVEAPSENSKDVQEKAVTDESN